MSKFIIAGSRNFDDYKLLSNTLYEMVMYDPDAEIVSGGSKGADKMGEKFAKSYGLMLKIFPADWSKHGKAAGPIRNKQMAEYADCLIAFWDGKSRGTKSMIDLAKKEGLKVYIIEYEF